MRQKIEFDWERLDHTTERARVIGGWVVRTITLDKNPGCSMVFVPDHEHGWINMPRRVESNDLPRKF